MRNNGKAGFIRRWLLVVLALTVFAPSVRSASAADGSMLTIVGEVSQPQTYWFAADTRVTLADLIRESGGRTTTSALAYVVRGDQPGSSLNPGIDVADDTVELQHGDVVVVCSPQRPNQRISGTTDSRPDQSWPEHAVIIPAGEIPAVIRISPRGMSAGRILESLGAKSPGAVQLRRVRVSAGRSVVSEINTSDTLHGGDVLFCHQVAFTPNQLQMTAARQPGSGRLHRHDIERAGFEVEAADSITGESYDTPVTATSVESSPDGLLPAEAARTPFDDLREQHRDGETAVEPAESGSALLMPPATGSDLKIPTGRISAAPVSLRTDTLSHAEITSSFSNEALPVDVSEPINAVILQTERGTADRPLSSIEDDTAVRPHDATETAALLTTMAAGHEVDTTGQSGRLSDSASGDTGFGQLSATAGSDSERTGSIWGIVLMVGLAVGVAMIVSGWMAAGRERQQSRKARRDAANRAATDASRQTRDATGGGPGPSHDDDRAATTSSHPAPATIEIHGTVDEETRARETDQPTTTIDNVVGNGQESRIDRDLEQSEQSPSIRIAIAADDEEDRDDEFIAEDSGSHPLSEDREELNPASTIPFLAARRAIERPSSRVGDQTSETISADAEPDVIASIRDTTPLLQSGRGHAVESLPEQSDQNQKSRASASFGHEKDVLPLSSQLMEGNDPGTDDLERLLRGNVLIRREKIELPVTIRLYGNVAGPRTLRIDPPQTNLAGPHFQLADSRSESRSNQVAHAVGTGRNREVGAEEAGQGDASVDGPGTARLPVEDEQVATGQGETALDRALRELNKQGEL